MEPLIVRINDALRPVRSDLLALNHVSEEGKREFLRRHREIVESFDVTDYKEDHYDNRTKVSWKIGEDMYGMIFDWGVL